MTIADLFRRDINRTIKEVVKVDLADEEVIADELDEYVATRHILDEFEKVLETYQETINSADEACTVWVSGFFGSGKSSWAKTLGYLLWNPPVLGAPAIDRFFERTNAPRLRALLNTIHAQAPTLSVLVNLATGSNVVAQTGESVVLPVYRALLQRLDYSPNFLLAELEITLEGDGLLDEFEASFEAVTGVPWRERRYTGLAKREAMEALDVIYGDRGSLPKWARELDAPDVHADWFVGRALELLKRRGNGATRVTLVVDEAGQYVARSVQRMLDLQGLAEACQKQKGRIWLVVTSQERLNDVVDSLESKQVELARAQARFPLRVDLLPSDIEEVTSKRILDKTEVGQQAVGSLVSGNRNKLAANTRLASSDRAADPGEDEQIRLYPLVPYQIQLLINAVSARRTQGGGTPTLGGSARTLISHSQQLITNPRFGIGGEEVGRLVTLDRSYDLLEEIIPTSWRSEVDQVAERYGGDSLDLKVMKVVALCADVPRLPLTAPNIAVLLHPAVDAETLRGEVGASLSRLVGDDRLRESGDGYKLQSPEQKDWEQARRAIDLSQGASVRLRRALLKQALAGLSVARGRTFKVDVTVEGENVASGALPLHIEEAESSRRNELRASSREQANENRITWVYQLSRDTEDALVELHRSRSMIERRDTSNKTPAEVELVGEEREREARHERTALQRLGRDLGAGQAIFRGRIEEIEEVDGSDLRPTAQRLVYDRVEEIYPQLDDFTANLRRDDVLHLLRTTDLGSVHESLQDGGINLVQPSPSGYELVTDSGPLSVLVTEVYAGASYGREPTGDHLQRHFAGPPYGASVELVQALCAAGLRAGLIEVVYQGQSIRNPSDARLDQVFSALPRFRTAAFRPPADTDVPLEKRVDLAEKLEHRGHRPPAHSTDALASTVRETFLPSRETAIRVESALSGLDIPAPEAVIRTRALLDRLSSENDVDVVETAHGTWADLISGHATIELLDELIESHQDELRMAQHEARKPADDLSNELATEHAELRDLLAAGDLADHAPRMIAIARRLTEARTAAKETAAARLGETLNEHRSRLRERFSDQDEAALAEALRPLDALEPPEDLSAVDAAALWGRIDSANARAQKAEQQLAELRAAGRLAWVRVSDLVPDVISEEAEIEMVLERVREAIAAHLSDGKHVRLE